MRQDDSSDKTMKQLSGTWLLVVALGVYDVYWSVLTILLYSIRSMVPSNFLSFNLRCGLVLP